MNVLLLDILDEQAYNVVCRQHFSPCLENCNVSASPKDGSDASKTWLLALKESKPKEL